MSQQITLFYRGKQQVKLNFSAEAVSSDGAIVLSKKIDRKYKLIQKFCEDIPEYRDLRYVDYSNVRYFVSNLTQMSAREIYLDFYVKRGDTSENRIKELKNMCYADRLSCHKFTANYLRLFFSCLCYEFYRLIKMLIAKTKFTNAHKWQIDNIRLYLMKVGAEIKKKARSIRISLSKAYICQDLFSEIIQLC